MSLETHSNEISKFAPHSTHCSVRTFNIVSLLYLCVVFFGKAVIIPLTVIESPMKRSLRLEASSSGVRLVWSCHTFTHSKCSSLQLWFTLISPFKAAIRRRVLCVYVLLQPDIGTSQQRVRCKNPGVFSFPSDSQGSVWEVSFRCRAFE